MKNRAQNAARFFLFKLLAAIGVAFFSNLAQGGETPRNEWNDPDVSTNSPCFVNQYRQLCTITIKTNTHYWYQNKALYPEKCIWLTNPIQLLDCNRINAMTLTWPNTSTTLRTVELRAHATVPIGLEAEFNAGINLDTANVYAIYGESQMKYYGYFYSAQDNSGAGDFDFTSEFSDHANLSLIGTSSINLDYSGGVGSMQSFIRDAVTKVASVTSNNAGTTGQKVKAILMVDPIFLRNSPNGVISSNLNPNRASDWLALIQALSDANLLDSIASFYFFDEPNVNPNVDANLICSINAFMRQNQAGRNIPILTIYNQNFNRPAIGCYDWVGLDDYQSTNMFTEISPRSGSVFSNFKNQLNSTQKIFVGPGVGATNAPGAPVLLEDPRAFYNGALAANAQGGPQIIGMLAFLWNANLGGLGSRPFDDYYRKTWRAIGTDIIDRVALTPIP